MNQNKKKKRIISNIEKSLVSAVKKCTDNFGVGVKIILIVIAFFSAMFFYTSKTTAAVSTKFNYQGKLSNASDVPVADGIYDMVAKMYDSASNSATALWTENWNTANLWTETGTTTVANGNGSNGCATDTIKISYAQQTNESSLKAGQLLWNTTLKQSSVIESVSTGSNYVCVYTPASTWLSNNDLTNRVYVKNGIFNMSLGSVTDIGIGFTGASYYMGIAVGSDPEMTPRKPLSAVPQAVNSQNAENLVSANGRIGIGYTGTANEAMNVNYNPGSGATSAAVITYGASGGTGTALKVVQSGSGKILGLYDNASEIFTVLDGGNVGIGNTNPTYNLQVAGTLGVGGTAYFAGNVGIGTTAPGAKLVVTGGAVRIGDVADGIQLGSSTGYGELLGIDIGSAGYNDIYMRTGSLPGLVLKTSGNVGIGTTNPGAALEVNGQVKITGGVPGASKVLTSDANGLATWTDISSSGGAWTLSTNDLYPDSASYNVAIGGVAAGTAKLYVNGNMGIGTTAPVAKLHIGMTGVTGPFTNVNDFGANRFHISAGGGNDSSVALTTIVGSAGGAAIEFGRESVGWKTKIAFYTNNGDTSSAGVMQQKMVIDNQGNVGIGTTGPAYRLDVNGITRFSSGSFINFASGTVYAGNSTGAGAGGGIGYGSSQLQIVSNASYPMAFYIGSNEKMRMDTLGNVGIGTTNPGAKLSVDGGIITIGSTVGAAGTLTSNTIKAGAASAYLNLAGGAGNAYISIGDSAMTLHTGVGASALSIESVDYGTVATFKSGNVGIGTTSPLERLVISKGTANVSTQISDLSLLFTRSLDGAARAGLVFDPTARSLTFQNTDGVGVMTFSNNGSEAMRILTNGNVGIGTTNPLNLFSVGATSQFQISSAGTVTSGTWNGSVIALAYGGTNRNMTASNGAVIYSDADSMEMTGVGTTGQVLISTGAGSPYWGSLSALPSGNADTTDNYHINTGTINYLTKYASSTALGASIVYDNGTNVGIGTTNPGNILHLKATSPNLIIDRATASNEAGLDFQTAGVSDWEIGTGISDVNSSFGFRYNTGTKMVITTGGNVGIGYLSPGTAALAINGNVGIGTTGPTSRLVVNTDDTERYVKFRASNSEERFNFYTGGTGNSANLQMFDYTGTNMPVMINAEGYSYFNGGSVGIGTTSPATRFHVVGTGTNETLRVEDNASHTGGLGIDGNGTYWGLGFYQGGSKLMTLDSTGALLVGLSYATGDGPANGLAVQGNVGIGTTSPTAVLHLKAGTATANTAPLKFTSGVNNTTAVAGCMEYDNNLYFTISDATRRAVVLAPNATKVTAAAPYTNDGYLVMNVLGTDFKIMTTA